MPRSCSDQCTSIDESNARANGDISPSHSIDSVDGPCFPDSPASTHTSFADEDPTYQWIMEGTPPETPSRDSDEEVCEEYPRLLGGDIVFKKSALDLPLIGKKKRKQDAEGPKKKARAEECRSKKKNKRKQDAHAGNKKEIGRAHV